jgi:hypothetical protein
MTPTLRLPLLPVLAVLWLNGTPCCAQFPEAAPTGLHTVSLNLTPAVNREVQLSYERALSEYASLEIIAGTRIPSNEDQVVRSRSISLVSSGGYESRVFTLPYEKSYAAGVQWKRYFYPDLGFVPFISPGVLYRYSYFNDKAYAEEYPLNLSSFTQQFSLRKHEVTARVLFGIRRQFYLRNGRSAFTAEASWGIGAGKRFGRFLNYRRQVGPGAFPIYSPWGGRPNDSPTVHFSRGVFTMPIGLNIGYSWGR